MTLHAVIGEGSINKRELNHQLDELRETASKAGDNCWFLIEGKEEPTQADIDMVEFFVAQELYFAYLAPEGSALADLYDSAEERHEYEGGLGAALVEAMTALQEDNDAGEKEGADLLALLINPKDDDPGDIDAIAVIEAAIDADFQVFGLNDSMEEITLDAEPEPAPVVAPVAKKTGGTKKAASKPEAEVEGDTNEAYTRTYLEGLTGPEAKALAQGMGLIGKNKAEYVQAILEHQGGVSEVTVTASPVITWSTGLGATNTTGTSGTVTYTAMAPPSVTNGVIAEGKVLVVIHSAAGVVTKVVDASAVAHL